MCDISANFGELLASGEFTCVSYTSPLIVANLYLAGLTSPSKVKISTSSKGATIQSVKT